MKKTIVIHIERANGEFMIFDTLHYNEIEELAWSKKVYIGMVIDKQSKVLLHAYNDLQFLNS